MREAAATKEQKQDLKYACEPHPAHDAAEVISDAHGHHPLTVAEMLGVNVTTGLSDEKASVTLERNGPNVLATASGPVLWPIFLRQFSSIVVGLLLAATVVAWFTSGVVEAAAIFVVLLLNALIGFAIEWRAGKALEALRDATRTMARVRRSGSETIIDAAGLATGDIIILSAGDRVPADARLIEAVNLESDESTLTGESVPVTKTIESVSPASVLTERRSMLYLGTMIVRGRALAIVTATGTSTELGRIGQLLAKTTDEQTPLERRLAAMGKVLVYVVIAIAGVVLLAGYLRGDDPALMFRVAVSLAVAAVPEALPAMTTLILALGVLRMARRHAIVRTLSAVEALGSTTVICADKTGTLTENRMTVREYRLSNGNTVDPLKEPTVDGLFDNLLRVSVLCNDAAPQSSDGHGAGDPTESALLIAARHAGLDVADERSQYEKIREHPFDALSKRMIVVLKNKQTGQLIADAKGGPGVILDMCSHYIDGDSNVGRMDSDTRQRFHAINDEMASRGLRVLAFARKQMSVHVDEELSGYTFLGFSGMTDPPREGVKSSIRIAKEAGIRVVMLTGDQTMTARAIAGELDLSHDGHVYAMHASEIAGLEDEVLADAAGRAHVFARVSPEDKLRIVEALQRSGEIVAVTGDGINDAPALKRADIGIAMGGRGTEVAKEAADIVLTDDNFSTIVNAIEGGRTIYSNIIKFVHLMFSNNLGEVLVIFIAIVSGLPLPLFPLQILWLNMVTDIFPALALAVEPASGETMSRRPRPAGETLLSPRFLFLISWQGAMLASVTLGAYVWALNSYGEGPHARTVALLALVGVQFGHVFNCRSRTRSAFSDLFSNPYIFAAAGIVILLQLAAFSFDPLAELLELVPPNGTDLVVISGCVLIPILIVEISKQITRKPALSSVSSFNSH